jgi:hypothetical protein
MNIEEKENIDKIAQDVAKELQYIIKNRSRNLDSDKLEDLQDKIRAFENGMENTINGEKESIKYFKEQSFTVIEIELSGFVRGLDYAMQLFKDCMEKDE